MPSHQKLIFFLVGVGGNLVAVQASRLSTALHRQGKPGEFKDPAQYYSSKICPNPYKVFCSRSMLTFHQSEEKKRCVCRKQFLHNTSFVIHDNPRAINICLHHLAIGKRSYTTFSYFPDSLSLCGINSGKKSLMKECSMYSS